MPDTTDTVRFTGSRGRVIALGVVCLAIAALGAAIVALSGDNVVNLLLGAAVVGLFGVGGGISVIGQLRDATVIRADAEGMRIARHGRVSWADVDRIETTPRGELGIRLRRPDSLWEKSRRGVTRETLRATRSASGGFDLTFTARELGTPAADAARTLRQRRP